MIYISALFAFALAVLVAIKDRRAFANRCFIAFLVLMASRLVFAEAGDYIFALAPGTLLLFSLSFGRHDYRQYLRKWKYIIAAAFVMPFAAILRDEAIGYNAFYALVLLCAVLILANFERTFRASTGRIRWQIKFIILGTGILCAAWIYSASQALIYRELDPALYILRPVSLLIACFLFAWGLLRSSFLKVDVYLSRSTIQYSLTASLASLYLILLALLAYLVRYFEIKRPLALDALIILLALTSLALLLLSDRLQERLKRLVTRHFKRPLYDYRKAWMELTENTNSLMNTYDLCSAGARIISRTFNILSVNIWLCDDAHTRLSLSGSTVFARSEAMGLERKGSSVQELLLAAKGRSSPLDLMEKIYAWPEAIMGAKPEYFADYKMRYIIPLHSGGQLVGIITLNNDRVGKSPLSIEDQDLLGAYAAQLAARVLQLRLSEDLRKAQEIETFQNISAFFVHDLKNIASRLSLTMQNLPAYFDNPDFREDALKLIGRSVEKIDETCNLLSTLKQKIELKPMPVDLAAMVADVLDDFQRCNPISIERDLQQVPSAPIDKEQLEKVLTNLLLNAREAINGNGVIRVSTLASDQHVLCEVSDNGCGMAREFVENSLFRPFQTTKKKGIGIGLFHSKIIVEAHKGTIEVESEPGKGTTFRVVLPT